jgi:hypothetical protein
MSKTYIKQRVCTSCLSPSIVGIDCICVYSNNYPVIELEFEHCNCCNNTSNQYADTEFNQQQLKQLEDESKTD